MKKETESVGVFVSMMMDRLTISVASENVDVMLYQIPLGNKHLILNADMPEESTVTVKSKGTVEVEAEKITVSGEALSISGSLRHSDDHKE